MAFYKEVKYPGNTAVYIWHVTESIEDLKNMCNKKSIYTYDTLCTKSQSRKTELLVTKLLLNLIFGEKVTLGHHENGAPYIVESDIHISVSHTHGAVCIAINNVNPIGVDIERIGTRVIRIRDKFLNDMEKRWLVADDINGHLIAWTAKEALFKVIPDSGIDFREHLSLSLFEAGENHSITFQSRYTKKAIPETYNITSKIYMDYIISLAYKQ